MLTKYEQTSFQINFLLSFPSKFLKSVTFFTPNLFPGAYKADLKKASFFVFFVGFNWGNKLGLYTGIVGVLGFGIILELLELPDPELVEVDLLGLDEEPEPDPDPELVEVEVDVEMLGVKLELINLPELEIMFELEELLLKETLEVE